jgi:pimeloyl-ACP methyl ester carboxylesterase
MTSNAELFVDDGGTGGLPVVFLHSGAGNTTHWAGQFAHLRPSRRALAIDLPGHGRSPAPADGNFGMAQQAAAVAAVLEDRLQLSRFALVGHSMGGAVAVALAGAHPRRVAGLFLLDPATDGRAIPKDQAAGLMSALRSDAYAATAEAFWTTMLEGATAETRTRLFADLKRTSPAAVAGGLEGQLAFDPVTPLRRYPGPKLAVITRVNDSPAAYHALVPELPHRRVEGTGHWVQLDAPAAVNQLLDEFLAGVESSAVRPGRPAPG